MSSINIRNSEKNLKIEEQYIDKVLQIHNKLREKHNSPPLNIDISLNKKAKQYANILFNYPENYVSFTHKKEPLGENIYIDIKKEPIEICQDWYNEKENYKNNTKKFQKESLHFTQIVWKNTKFLGFGYVSSGNQCCAVALYFPPGNIFNDFEKNV